MISFKMIVFIYSTELDSCGKVVRVVWTIVRILLFLLALYVFFCSLDFLSSAFKLLGGKFAFDQWIILNWTNHAMNSMQLELKLFIKRCWLVCKYVNTLYDGEISLNQDQCSRR